MMNVSRLSFVLLLWMVLSPSASAREPDAREWLERMSEALANGNYEGRFFHLRDSRSETMRIIHRVHRGKVTERLVSLDGSGREFIRNETEVICYLPDQRRVVVEKRTNANSLLAVLPNYSDDLESHYNIEKSQVSKALGRKTQLILVQPRDQYRYGYRLWLDYETAMPLKTQLCDRNGNVIEQILFAELNLRDRIPADQLKPSVTGEGFEWIRQIDHFANAGHCGVEWAGASPGVFRRTGVRLGVHRTAQLRRRAGARPGQSGSGFRLLARSRRSSGDCGGRSSGGHRGGDRGWRHSRSCCAAARSTSSSASLILPAALPVAFPP